MPNRHESYRKDFCEEKTRVVDNHKAIVSNPFTRKLPLGRADPAYVLSHEQMAHSALQWLAFSNEFPAIQALHLARTPLADMRRSARNILGNEIGTAISFDTGDIDSKTFKHKNAHVEWMERFARMLEVRTSLLDYWDRADETTRAFLESLYETYGSRDYFISAGASYAVEMWAGYGLSGTDEDKKKNFWSEEIEGIDIFNEVHRVAKGKQPLPTNFFEYHRRLEVGHVANVEDELVMLEERIGCFDEDKWLDGARRALDGVYLFFHGRAEHCGWA